MRPLTFGQLAPVLALVIAACGPDEVTRRLAIDEPLPAGAFCTGQDVSSTVAGFQLAVSVVATEFPDGDELRILIDGVADDQHVGRVANQRVEFAQVTIPDGSHLLTASSMDGGIVSASVQVAVDTRAPAIELVRPTPGGTIRTPADDLDLATDTTVDYDVEVLALVEDDQPIELLLTPPGGGAAVSQGIVPAANRRATFRVPFTVGSWQLEARAETACGNPGSTTAQVNVEAPEGPDCTLALTPTPHDVPGVGAVLRAEDDASPAAGIEADVAVATAAGNSVTLFLDDVVVAIVLATEVGGAGEALFPVNTLDEGVRTLRAECRDPVSELTTPSIDSVVLVDVTPPTCAVTAPADGATLIPTDDTDATDDDIDFAVLVAVSGTDALGASDVDGQLVTAMLGTGALPDATVVGGVATFAASFASPVTGIALDATGSDRAGNSCTVPTITLNAQLAGCAIAFTAPTTVVTTDADVTVGGVQVAVTVTVADACAGRTVTITGCNLAGDVTAVAAGAPATATTTITACGGALCDVLRTCTARVTDSAGIVTTSLPLSLRVDTQPPIVTLAVSAPPGTTCGATISASADVDAGTPGVQIMLQVLTSPAVLRWIEIVPDTCGPTCPVTAMDSAVVTLTLGTNLIDAHATDVNGNTGSSAPCTIILADLAVAITSPLAGALLGPGAGTVIGGDLSVDVCGTVGAAGATVELQVDGVMPGSAAVVTGMTWCATVLLTPGSHALVAAATAPGPVAGNASASVTVDLSAPDAPTGLTATALRRNAASVSWTTPADPMSATIDGCDLKADTAPITAATWSTLPLSASTGPRAPGFAESTTVTPLRLGAWHFGVVCFDSLGNDSALVTTGPVTVDVTQGPVIGPEALPLGDISAAHYSYAVSGGDLDDDGFSDVIVGAWNVDTDGVSGFFNEGAAYVYMGSAAGISADPSFVLRGTGIGGDAGYGSSVTVLDWNNDGTQDLVVGAPLDDGYQGLVFIYYGGSAWAPGPSTIYLDDTSADVTISVSPSTSFFQVGWFGWALERVDFNGDGRDDLLTSLPATDSFRGGGVVLYGTATGSTPYSFVIPDDLATPASQDARAHLFRFSSGVAVTVNASYGTYLAAVGALGDGAGVDTREDIVMVSESGSVSGGTAVSSEERAFVFYGRAMPASGFAFVDHGNAEETIHAPNGSNNFFGRWVGSIADQNGDGNREITISAVQEALGRGRVFIVPGGTSSLGVSEAPKNAATVSTAIIEGITGGDFAGTGIGNTAGHVADLDGDGLEDLVTARRGVTQVHGFYGGGLSGIVPVSSADGSWDATPAFPSFTGIFWVGDVNGDGLEDFVRAHSAYSVPVDTQPGAIQVMY